MENFDVKVVTESDFVILREWWKFWKVTPPTREMLPQRIQDGIMVYYGKEKLCAGFVYATSSTVFFWMGHIISSPEQDREVRKKGLKLLIELLIATVEQSGGKYIYASINNPNLIKHYEEAGFIQGSTSVEMIKVINF